MIAVLSQEASRLVHTVLTVVHRKKPLIFLQFPVMTMDICGGRGKTEKISVFSLCAEMHDGSIEQS